MTTKIENRNQDHMHEWYEYISFRSKSRKCATCGEEQMIDYSVKPPIGYINKTL